MPPSGIGYDDPAKQRRCEIRQNHEDRYSHDNGKCHSQIHDYLLSFLAKQLIYQLIRFGRLGLFLVVKAGRKGQAFHAQHQGIHEADNAPHDGKPLQPFITDALIGTQMHLDLSVRLSHTHGIDILIFHHNAFQNRLSADS